MRRSTIGLRYRNLGPLALLALVVFLLSLAIGCGEGLSRAEVEEIVRAELAENPGPTQSEPALTSSDVDEAIRKAMADLPPPATVLTRSEVEEIVEAAIASVPSKSAPADYTRYFVNNAIGFYETQGLDATIAHYNNEENVDGQWYAFIIDESDKVIGHPDPSRLGLDVKGWVGTDANGYNFGLELLSATEDGKWVSYVFRNPEAGGVGSGNYGDLELKNVWVVRHDGLLFASGWYINANEFTKRLVSVAVDKFNAGGLEATVAYFASPGSVLSGLESAINYYNSAETIDGKWSAFVSDESGRILAHSNPAMIGMSIGEAFGLANYSATEEGEWVESESLRIWIQGAGGYAFGSGWHRD